MSAVCYIFTWDQEHLLQAQNREGWTELPTGVTDENVVLERLLAAQSMSMLLVGDKSNVHHNSK